MKNKIIYFILLSCLIFIYQCTKYPEGGLSTRAVRNLANGTLSEGKTWRVAKYVVNGIDSTKEVTGLVASAYSVGTIRFTRDFFEKTKQLCQTKHYTYNSELTNRRSTLIFSREDNTCNSSDCEYDILNPLKTSAGITVWKIRKLTKNELVLLYLNQSIFELTLTTE